MNMSPNVEENTSLQDESESRKQQSLLACESCRRRKIKCDRELPRCSICIKSQQTCTYRDGPLKPGPKIGASQKSRKRQRTEWVRNDTHQDLASRQDNIRIPTASTLAGSGIRSGGSENERPTDDDFLNLPNRSSLITDFGSVFNYSPLSPETTISANTPRSGMSINSLSFIMHPSHENKSGAQKGMDRESSANGPENLSSDGEPILIARACYALNICPETLYRLIDLYFERMTSFSLFREPYFRAKILAISSLKQLNALLAAMLSFSSRFDSENAADSPRSIPTSEYFLGLALKFVDEALQENETPTLCLLQALTLTTFQQLIRGVQTQAWRSLGTCVRVAYELYLHLIDSENIDQSVPLSDSETNRWCLDEEKRRVWWAIWEMDTFASTIRRCPTGIDWSQNETNLPVDDAFWFRGEFQASCFLAPTPMERWRTLQCSRNQSPKGWFIVANSLMREAQLLSSPRGVFRSSAERSKSKANTVFGSSRKTCKEISQSLAIIDNALRCFQLALPANMKYRGEYMSFASSNGKVEEIHQQTSIYSIHIMMQLTKFMIYHHGVFGGGRRKHCLSDASGQNTPPNEPVQSASIFSALVTLSPDMEALSRYSDAADKVLLIVNNAAEEHIQHVNPFLASTIWLAAAVQLVCKVFTPPGTNKTLIESNFEVLRLNYKQYVDYWKASTSLQRNLDCLAEQLQRFCSPRTSNQVTGLDDTAIFFNSTAQDGSELAPYRMNNAWLSQGWNLEIQDTSLGASNSYEQTLFDGNPMQIRNGSIEKEGDFGPMDSNTLEVLEGLAFGLDFGTNADLPGYLTGLLSGSYE